jgi:hypothetical protein
MRIITAFKLLIKYYYRIIPTYLLAAIVLFIGSQILPLIGALLLLPLSIGVAYVMVFETTAIRHRHFFPLLYGFKGGNYGRNVWYLLLRQFVQYLPLGIGVLLDYFFSDSIPRIGINLPFMRLGTSFLIFTIPAGIISLLVSMVPYILADPKYNVKKANPLKISALLLKGNYIKLLSIRLIFMPFILWASSGLILSLISFYTNLFGDSIISPTITTSWLFSAPVLFMVFTPWYMMTHAVLYSQIRDKLKGLMLRYRD